MPQLKAGEAADGIVLVKTCIKIKKHFNQLEFTLAFP